MVKFIQPLPGAVAAASSTTRPKTVAKTGVKPAGNRPLGGRGKYYPEPR
jgi:hypothetical protein